jgi:hypothetical protein
MVSENELNTAAERRQNLCPGIEQIARAHDSIDLFVPDGMARLHRGLLHRLGFDGDEPAAILQLSKKTVKLVFDRSVDEYQVERRIRWRSLGKRTSDRACRRKPGLREIGADRFCEGRI